MRLNAQDRQYNAGGRGQQLVPVVKVWWRSSLKNRATNLLIPKLPRARQRLLSPEMQHGAFFVNLDLLTTYQSTDYPIPPCEGNVCERKDLGGGGMAGDGQTGGGGRPPCDAPPCLPACLPCPAIRLPCSALPDLQHSSAECDISAIIRHCSHPCKPAKRGAIPAVVVMGLAAL
jgi:hypothetical protein